MDVSVEELDRKFMSIGLNETRVKDTLKNKKLSSALNRVIDEAKLKESGCDRSVGNLLMTLANESLKQKDTKLQKHEPYICSKIVKGDIKSTLQVNAAIGYCKNTDSINEEEFDKELGVGVTCTPEQITELVGQYIKENEEKIVEQRYASFNATSSALRQHPILKWASQLDVKQTLDKKYLELLGPKDERDAPTGKKGKGNKGKADTKEQKKGTTSSSKSNYNMFEEGFLAKLHKPGGNPQLIPERMKEHLQATGGGVVTRFPPEPNGYLHIGHSKAIAVNFGFARHHKGICYLRFDDTNPEAEEAKYFESIKDIISWLGFSPYKITYSSDYFDQLYALAELLIKKDKGYICHCTDAEIKKARGGEERGPRYACVHRNRPIEESLAEFRNMRDGKYKPKEAILRMKQNLDDGNPQMWDLIAYRVLDTPHPRTGDKWKIYPTYDFTHCLVDSFENITHSLCTTEFILSRVSYEWLCNSLEVYCPAQREYGRLNVVGTLMSKRKIMKLVNEGYVHGWDDPRLYTLVALRRRGVPPGAILEFVSDVGVTTAVSNIEVARFENCVRSFLENSVPRLMFLPDPVKITLENLADDYREEIQIPFNPKNPSMGSRTQYLTKTVYIDRSDFREEASSDFFRLTLNQPVGLFRASCPVVAKKIIKDDSGKVVEIIAEYDQSLSMKPKTFVQWVSEDSASGSPVRLSETRLYNNLFKCDNPAALKDHDLADQLNPESEIVLKNSMVETGIYDLIKSAPWPKTDSSAGVDKAGSPESVRFQAMRVGYFCLDKTSKGQDELVLNRIVSLRGEEAAKNKD
ncbi:cytoplasmic glutaminyl-tRNA ligase Qrs1 [Schizosaccharomyces octosporus yFS286]|uniref:glutamine--tRNA ligase n=1 Tax=Schizosaccharomyces octosporus (strain yFS286) TaxID=483514 RepID=S9RGP1_SCHOY|nr:cytoplasmic glutaminyl-tRNA ligase Qrs1 [Schizosaccharomyces octosporus yFS286]EPX73219.1 cytoplasmic glutaminyl-tRNA ligase Qrs1 [Schizosaccharomyces octosporus yFS286]